MRWSIIDAAWHFQVKSITTVVKMHLCMLAQHSRSLIDITHNKRKQPFVFW